MQLQKPKTNEQDDKRSKKLNKTQKPVQTDKFLMQTYESKGKGELWVWIRGRKEWQRKKLLLPVCWNWKRTESTIQQSLCLFVFTVQFLILLVLSREFSGGFLSIKLWKLKKHRSKDTLEETDRSFTFHAFATLPLV